MAVAELNPPIVDAGCRPRILSLSCVYPNPILPGLGLFVRRRLQHLSMHADVKVISPLAVFQYGGPAGARVRTGDGRCPARRQDGLLEVMHPRWFYPPMGGSLNALLLASQLIGPMTRLKKRFPFEVIDAHFGYPDGIAAALLGKALAVPFTITLRGNETLHATSRLTRRWMRWALSSADRVFTVSDRLRQFAIDLGADPAKVKTIPNGIDAEVFYARDRIASREKHGFDPHLPLIVSAGALIERKGHHKAVRAVRSLISKGTNVQLAIVGGPGAEGQYEQEIRRTVSSLSLEDSVRFIGSVSPDAMAEIMSCADLLCLPSTREGWPNVVHESLACGTPVVATDVGAVPDMLPDPRYGFVVPANDQQALDLAVKTAVQKAWDRDLIAKWGQNRSWHRVAEEVAKEIQSVLGERRTRVGVL